MIGFPNGTNIMQEKIVKDFDKSDGLGFEMAKLMIDNGALELLKRAEETAFKDEMPQRL
jgi:hydroxymethylbilane synthase